MTKIWFAALALSVAAPASAQSIGVEDEAEWASAALGKIRPGPNRNFYNGYAEGCPASTPKCREKAYLVAGDMVVTHEAKGQFTRVEFVSLKGRSRSGWIETAGLDKMPVAASGWAGSWRGTEQSIDIKPARKPGQFQASGDATWGAEDPDRVARGGVHIGAFSGMIVPTNGRATMIEAGDSNGCQVKMRLIGPYMLAVDNGNCGGVNVRFYGALRTSAR